MGQFLDLELLLHFRQQKVIGLQYDFGEMMFFTHGPQ